MSQTEQTGFSELLRVWRTRRRLSQLELSLQSGVSQRHVSFLESGRSKPSRTMIVQLAETLDVPLVERNEWLLAAGFAPIYRSRALHDPQMAQVMNAVSMMLSNHEPFPAIAIDRAWNIKHANRAFEALSQMLGAELWPRVGGTDRNLMRLFYHPEGIRPFVRNWEQAAPLLWHRAQREANASCRPDLRDLLNDLAQFQDAETLWSAEETSLVPILPLELEKNGVRVSLFTVISTFGTPLDITADELRIESLFPADEATDKLFRTMIN